MNIWEAIKAVQDRIGVLAKDANNPFFHSKYCSMENAVLTVQPILHELGLVIVQPFAGDQIKTVLYHIESGVTLESLTPIVKTVVTKKDQDNADKKQESSPQQFFAGSTYARRYAYLAILGLVAAEEDDDGETAEGRGRSRRNGRPEPEDDGPMTIEGLLAKFDSAKAIKHLVNTKNKYKPAIETWSAADQSKAKDGYEKNYVRLKGKK